MRRMVIIGVVLLAFVAMACRPYDFDADGKADVVVIDHDGRWYRSGDPTPIFEPPPGSEPRDVVPGDYDGNKVAEPAYVTYEGEWHTGGGRGTFTFPRPPGVEVYAVPADYDGDRTTEPAWYRADDATWFVEGETPQVFGRGLDTAPSEWIGNEDLPLHDVPVPGDYDGDGADDLATYRVPEGTFHVAGLGEIADLPLGFPAPGDYDGDGTDEPVVYRDASFASGWMHGSEPDFPRGWNFADGSMVALPDPDGVSTRYLLPAPADYDGDGADDLALWTLDDDAFVYADGRAPVRVDVDVPATEAGPFRTAATVRPWLLDEVVRLTFLVGVASDVVPHDYDDDTASADHAAVDEHGDWYRAGAVEPFFAGRDGWFAFPAAGDYDGDGVWEPANVYDGGAGGADLSLTFETGGGRGTFSFDVGAITPAPTGSVMLAPGDYDGDLVTEPAVFSPADARWYLEGRNEPIEFGTPSSAYPEGLGEIALPGDYDADGEDELAVYRPLDGTVHVRGLGQVADLPRGWPIVGDFDGNGADEPAVYAFHEPVVHFADGSSTAFPVTLSPTDVFHAAAVADFDGDGADDALLLHGDALQRADGTTVAFGQPMLLPGTPLAGMPEAVIRLIYVLEQCAGSPELCA